LRSMNLLDGCSLGVDSNRLNSDVFLLLGN
jgi:hypothetical protein